DLTRLKPLDDWEQLVDLDELYDLAARIPDVEKLRVKSISIDPLPRAKDARFVAKITIKGELRNVSNLREPLDKLNAQFTKDGYYSPQAPRVESNIFTLDVFVERRPPEEYKHVLAEPKTASKAKSKTDEDAETAATEWGV